MRTRPTLSRRVASEAVGTGFLLAIVAGSGIMGARLSNGIDGLALMANALATGAGLAALIVAFGPLSGAHFNPLVTALDAVGGGLPWREALPYGLAQVAGAVLGVMAAHLMFGEPLLQTSTHARNGLGQAAGEMIATFGLLFLIQATREAGLATTAAAVGLYITSAYWFTSSTSFANPAVTIARAFTDSFVGIRPADVPMFCGAQLAGGFGAVAFWRWLVRGELSRSPASKER